MRKADIEAQNSYLLKQQREFRIAADAVAKAWMKFEEVEAIAVIGSVPKSLWKEIPRFSDFRRAGIEVWHECKDLDLALWIAAQHRLGEIRRAASLALRRLFESGGGSGVANHQLDVFLIEPGTDLYLGRLCHFNECPKGKSDCLVPGCGTIRFNRKFENFRQCPDLLERAEEGMLYRRGVGLIRSALDFSGPGLMTEEEITRVRKDHLPARSWRARR